MTEAERRRVEAHFEAEATPEVRWVVSGLSLWERLNEPFALEVELWCDEDGADPLRLLGSNCAVRLERAGLRRVLKGLVTKVSVGRSDQGETWATLTIEPALCALRFDRDCRIFQEMSVPEILAQVLAEGLVSYGREASLGLERDYPKREYTVQYEESRFDFVHRLMEEEGIFYAFECDEEGQERLVLHDHPSHYRPYLGTRAAMLEYSDVASDHAAAEHDYVRSFWPTTQIQGTETVTRYYDWTKPGSLREGWSQAHDGIEPQDGARWGPTRQSFERDEPHTFHSYAGTSYFQSDASEQARVRRERQRRDACLFRGTSTAIGLRPGCRFDLSGHPEVELNEPYLVVEAVHQFGTLLERGGEEAATSSDTRFDNRFECLKASHAWRPARTRPRPRIRGIQSATVVGPAGEEIHTDEHGRVKVQFHWDRRGAKDERSSCWIRVMQSWAGAGWGALFLPRIGMEVVVAFMDGDPDRPLVTGCVYNGDNRPPYPLPEEKTKSTVKSNSSLGGGGYNELRFEDLKGGEEVYLHAQKDLNEVVENDHTTLARHDQHIRVLNDQSRFVGHDQSVEIGNDQKNVIHHDQDTVVQHHRQIEVLGSQRTVVRGTDTLKKGGRNLRGSWLVVHQDYIVDTTRSITARAPEQIRILCTATGEGASAGTGSSIVMDPESITFVCGASSMALKTDGTIELAGAAKVVSSSAGSSVEIDPNGVRSSGATVKSEAIGLHEILGALIKIN